MESKVEKISDRKVKINAFNFLLWVRGLISLASLVFFIIISFCNAESLSPKFIILITIFSYVIYVVLLRDMFVSHTRYVEMCDEYIVVDRRKILKQDMSYVSVVVSSMNSVSVITSYRVDIILKKGFFRRITLIPFTGNEEKLAVQTGKEIADFLGIEFKDLTHSWE